MPRFLLKNFDKADTRCITDPPLATDRERWPVVVFSPGYGAPRSFYTGLIAELSGRGVVVLTINHPDEAGVAMLANGSVVPPQQNLQSSSIHRPV
jgi:predicted dienelactone hydrolase